MHKQMHMHMHILIDKELNSLVRVIYCRRNVVLISTVALSVIRWTSPKSLSPKL